LADICIIYARKDAATIPPALETLLTPDWTVWWDGHIIDGDYRAAIEAAIRACHVLIPIWSGEAQLNAHMHDELRIAKDAGVAVVPFRIHDVDAPLGYGSLQATTVLGWSGEPDRRSELSGFKDLIRKVIEKRTPNARPRRIGLTHDLDLPCFFYAVSSHETRLKPAAALRALDMFGVRSLLVSGFDTGPGATAGIVRTLESRRAAGAVVFLDSGNYEKARKDNKDWSFPTFRAALKGTPHDAAFAFDKLEPKGDTNKVAAAAINAAERTARYTSAPVIPIVHLPRQPDGDYTVEIAGPVMRLVAQALHPAMIAIPERELGSGVFARAKTMDQIRRALKGIGWYQPVHVLGAGNPITLALLSAAGADSFDGLEWCRYAADAEHAQLHHFQLFEMFEYQLAVAESAVAAEAANLKGVSYTTRAVMHNLDFYETWLKQFRTALRDEKQLVTFISQLLPKGAMKQAHDALPEIL
jgi:hypothetical protein